MWNPGYVILFATGVTISGYFIIKTGRALHTFIMALALAIGLQIHMQMAMLSIGILVAVILFRPRLNWHHIPALLGGLLIPYLPSLIAAGPSLLLYIAGLPG